MIKAELVDFFDDFSLAHEFDWCRFVLEHVIDGANEVTLRDEVLKDKGLNDKNMDATTPNVVTKATNSVDSKSSDTNTNKNDNVHVIT